MFSDAVVYSAAHVIYANCFASEGEERGVSFPGGQNLYNYVPALTPAEHDPIIKPVLAKINKELGTTLFDIFVAGGIETEEAQIDALSDLLLGAEGHGVSIQDNYAKQWEEGCRACGSDGKLPYCDCDFDPYSDLANEKLDAAGYPPEPEEDKEPKESEPIIETAFNWHGGQDSALYAFASTREVQSETHRANTLDEIDTSIDWHKVNQEQHEGDVAKLQRLRQAVKDAKIGERFFYI